MQYSLYNQRRGSSLSFKRLQVSTPCTHNYRAASLRDAGLQLQRPTCEFLTFQTLLLKLQHLGSDAGVDPLKFCARCWWVEATSEWRLVKHPTDGHWSRDWSV